MSEVTNNMNRKSIIEVTGIEKIEECTTEQLNIFIYDYKICVSL